MLVLRGRLHAAFCIICRKTSCNNVTYAYNNSGNGYDGVEKTPEELKREMDRKKREMDRKRYANMTAEAKKEKISKIIVSRNLNNIMRSRNLNDGGNYVYLFLVLTPELINFLINLQWVL